MKDLAKPLMILAAVAGLLLFAGGAYYVGSKAGFNKAVAQGNAKVAELTQAALQEKNRLVARHQQEVAQYVQAQRNERQRVAALETQLDSVVSGGCAPGDVVSVLAEAIDSPTLPRNADKPFAVGAGDAVEEHHLYCISEYNRVAGKLNQLIDSIK